MLDHFNIILMPTIMGCNPLLDSTSVSVKELRG